MFSDLVDWVFTVPVNFLSGFVLDFGDISFSLWDFCIGATVLFIVVWMIKRILE